MKPLAEHREAWEVRDFQALPPQVLYDILQLRQEVFALEQACLYQDMDGEDANALHLTVYEADVLLGYARIFAPGKKYQQASIGRIVTRSSVRGTGLGKRIVENSIDEIMKRFGPQDIKIAAQCYLEKFYRCFGFRPIGEVYPWDGIDHIDMIRGPLTPRL